ncbi:hypothetical protein NL676_039092 [Syzygium grande]|nr:hypothetical protein NL676_039092 [Syzygium grande]
MEAQRQQPNDHESNREAERRTADRVSACITLLLTAAGVIALLIFLFDPGFFLDPSPTVSVASLSLSLSSTLPLPAIGGNWSVALSVKNPTRQHRFGWDHAVVMLFHRHEFVAGTFLERLRVAPRGNATLETGAIAFSRGVGERAARAMGMDREDDGVMELEVVLLHHEDGSRYRLGWDSFDCRGLKVGFSSQNQSQVGLLLSGAPHKCT